MNRVGAGNSMQASAVLGALDCYRQGRLESIQALGRCLFKHESRFSMRFLPLIAAVATFALCATNVHAVEMQPGLWELTTKVYRKYAVSIVRSRPSCITAESTKAARAMGDVDMISVVKGRLKPFFGQDACKITDTINGPQTATWHLKCAGSRSVEQVVIVQFDNPRHYQLVIKTSTVAQDKTRTSLLRMEGQHKGECPR
jgi:hypothetical protein